MPEEEKKPPAQRPADQSTERREYSQRNAAPQDGEILKASGARPSPSGSNPNPGTSDPVNKAVDPTEVSHFSVDNAGDALPQERAAAPPPPPPADSEDGGS